MDSNRGDSEGFAAIRNLFNGWYPRDTSKKVRVSLRQRGTSGKHKRKVKIFFNFVDDVDIPIISEPIATETTYGPRKTA